MRAGIITQARMTSSRLPGKVLLPFAGTTIIGAHLDRLALADAPVVLATTTNAEDDLLAQTAVARGVAVVRGDEQDVLGRFTDAADAAGLDVVVRVTSDCPLVDGRLIANGLAQWRRQGDSRLYLSNTVDRTFPRGFDFEIFSAASLREARIRASRPEEREHVTPWLRAEQNGHRVVQVVRDRDGAESIRLTLDTSSDYRMLSRLSELVPELLDQNCEQVISGVRSHPELVEVNAHVEQKPG